MDVAAKLDADRNALLSLHQHQQDQAPESENAARGAPPAHGEWSPPLLTYPTKHRTVHEYMRSLHDSTGAPPPYAAPSPAPVADGGGVGADSDGGGGGSRAVLKQGWLELKSGDTHIDAGYRLVKHRNWGSPRRNWKWRWFVLYDDGELR